MRITISDYQKAEVVLAELPNEFREDSLTNMVSKSQHSSGDRLP